MMSSIGERFKSTDQHSQKLIVGYIRSINKNVANTPINLILLFYDELPSLIQNCFSDDSSLYYKSAQQIRKIISRQKEPPIQTVIDSGMQLPDISSSL